MEYRRVYEGYCREHHIPKAPDGTCPRCFGEELAKQAGAELRKRVAKALKKQQSDEPEV